MDGGATSGAPQGHSATALFVISTGLTTAGMVTADPGTDPDDVLALAASLDQSSAHVLAGAIVATARERGLALHAAEQVTERTGYGVAGRVGSRSVRLGKASFVVSGRHSAWVRQARRRAALDGSLTVFVAVNGVPTGVLLLEDPLRPDAPRMVRVLRAAGVSRVVLVTGDRADTAETVGRIVGSMRSTPNATRPTNWTSSALNSPGHPRSWPGTASTTRPRWPPQGWGWRWRPGARPSLPRPPTWC